MGLKAKFALVFGIFFLLTAEILGTGLYYIFRLKGDAQKVNYADSERVRSFKLTLLLNKYVMEVQREAGNIPHMYGVYSFPEVLHGSSSEAIRRYLREQIYEELTLFEEIIYGLRDGKKELGLDGVRPGNKMNDIHTRLTSHIEYYQGYLKPRALGIIESVSPEKIQTDLAEFNRFIPPFVDDIDYTVRLFEAESRGKLSQFLNAEFLLIGVAVALTGFATVFVTSMILSPVKKIEQGVVKLSHGEWGERISLRTGDEIEELANSFNNMAAELAKKYRLLEEQNERLKELNKLLGEIAIKDALTGLYNYYYFQETLKTEYQSARRYSHHLSLLMIDLDNFKTVNDLWGHSFGDFVLKEFAKLIKKHLRSSDITCRIGGEEFAIILTGTGLDGALEIGEKLKKGIGSHNFLSEGKACRLTVTIGLSSTNEPAVHSEADILKHADEALMEGKRRGRNSLVSWVEVHGDKKITKGVEMQGVVAYREKFLTAERAYKRSYIETTLAFLRALEAKDNYSARHSYLVADYCVKLANAVALSREEVEIIKNAALLHDIGKIGIPDNILMKKGSLTEEERMIVKKHAHMALSILEKVSLLEKEIPIIYHHQERWDGSGYPAGLRGKEIPLGARILGIADAFEALTSDRPYRKGRPHEEAFEELGKGAGSQFDPELVPVFIRTLKEVIDEAEGLKF